MVRILPDETLQFVSLYTGIFYAKWVYIVTRMAVYTTQSADTDSDLLSVINQKST